MLENSTKRCRRVTRQAHNEEELTGPHVGELNDHELTGPKIQELNEEGQTGAETQEHKGLGRVMGTGGGVSKKL